MRLFTVSAILIVEGNFVRSTADLACSTRDFPDVSDEMEQLRNAGCITRQKNKMSFEQEGLFILGIVRGNTLVEEVEFFHQRKKERIEVSWLCRSRAHTEWEEMFCTISSC